MKYPERYIDMRGFIDYAWKRNPTLASTMSEWWDAYRHACKLELTAYRLNLPQDKTEFTVDNRFRVKLDGMNMGLFLAASPGDGALCWSSTEMDLVLQMTLYNIALKNIITPEGFMAEYSRLLTDFRAAFQVATAEGDA
ncbi:hypothetical protein ACQKHH_06630 [Escherichia coli]|uniref:hypothetical protein n=1 Tax=Escherichia coli TaxID=562 RepID=UPI003D00CB30